MKLAGEFKLFGNKITHCLGEVLTLILPILLKIHTIFSLLLAESLPV